MNTLTNSPFRRISNRLLLGMLVFPLVLSVHSQTREYIPLREQVGPELVTEEIAPVQAPFAMPEMKRPVFKDLTYSIVETGAKPEKMVTKAIQKAIDEVSRKGGGKVVVPPGVWKTGRIELKSNVNLHLEEGAELHFSGNIKDYLPVVLTRYEGVEVYSLGALVYADNQENIALTGHGKLIAPTTDCEIWKHQCSVSIEQYVEQNPDVKERIADGKKGKPVFLPLFVSPTNCRNVLIEGVTLERSLFWNIVPVYCDGVIIRGVTVESHGHGRTDGIDIESTRNVLIEYCSLDCGDDCFTMKSGRGEDGLRVNKPSENIVVRYCLAKRGWGGVVCGSETAAMIRNLYVHDCVFSGTKSGVRFKTRRSRGGGGENLIFERIRMNLAGIAFWWDMLGEEKHVGDLAKRLPALPVTPLTPSFKNIAARDIIVESASCFIDLNGIPETPAENCLIENLMGKADKLIRMTDVKGFTLKNITIQSKDPTILINDGRDILFEQVHFQIPGGKVKIKTQGDLAKDPRFVRCLMKEY